MLLSNMTKVESVAIQLLGLRLPSATAPPATPDSPAPEAPLEDVEALDLLLEVFLKGEGKKYNPNANYDFLASVFANVSTVRPPEPADCSKFCSCFDCRSPPVDHTSSQRPRLKWNHPSPSSSRSPSTRRPSGGAVWPPRSSESGPFGSWAFSSLTLVGLRNSAFLKAAHTRLVAPTNDTPPTPGSIDLLPQMLLPLCGPEEFDLDVRFPSSLVRIDTKRAISPTTRTWKHCRRSSSSCRQTRSVSQTRRSVSSSSRPSSCWPPPERVVNPCEHAEYTT